MSALSSLLCFFFQAEDGIRDPLVTGVQTCALPILPAAAIDAVRAKGWRFYNFVGATGVRFMCAWDTPPELVDRFAADIAHAVKSLRSEERRVGKEGRVGGWGESREKKKGGRTLQDV